MQGDGNCLFRALAYPCDDHAEVRARAVEHMARHWEKDYGNFVDERVRDRYLGAMTCDGTWGGELELRAHAEVTGESVVVLDPMLRVIARYGPEPSTRAVVFNGQHYDVFSN